MGTTGDSVVQEERDRRGGHVLGAEENQGDLLVVQGIDVVVVTIPLHGENARYSPDTYPGGGCWRKGGGDICDVFSAGSEFDSVPDRQMPGKSKQPRDTYRTIHVSSLEGKGVDYI